MARALIWPEASERCLDAEIKSRVRENILAWWDGGIFGVKTIAIDRTRDMERRGHDIDERVGALSTTLLEIISEGTAHAGERGLRFSPFRRGNEREQRIRTIICGAPSDGKAAVDPDFRSV